MLLSKTSLLLAMLAVAHATPSGGGDGQGSNIGSGGGGGNGGDGGKRPELDRKDVAMEGKTIRIRNKVAGVGEFRLEARLEPFPLLRVAYRSKSGDAMDKFRFAAGFLKVIEYNDSVAPKDSENVMRLHKNDGDWNATVAQTSSDQGKVYTVRAEFKANAAKFANTTFAIILKATDYSTSINGTTLDPTAFKYDVEINNWPFQYSNSSIGLLQFMRTAEKIVLKDGELTAGSFGKLKFIKTLELENVAGGGSVSVEGGGLNVMATNDLPVDDDGEDSREPNSKILFKLGGVNGKSKIVWDPELSSDVTALQSTSAGAKTAGAAGLTTLIGAFVAMFAF